MNALRAIDAWSAPHAGASVVAPSGVVGSRGSSDRVLPWASVTKICTALATLIAVEEGSVGLDDPAGPDGSTVRHLLSHASGLGPDDPARPLASPATRRIYSNAGFEVLAGHVARRTGMAFSRYLELGVLEPLAMTTARLEGSPAAGLVGTLADLEKLAGELLTPTLCAPETLALARSVTFPGLVGVLPGFGRQEPCDWGLGFDLKTTKSPYWMGRHNSPESFGHFGQTGTFLWIDPIANLACGVLTDRPFGEWAVTAWPPFNDDVLDEFADAGVG